MKRWLFVILMAGLSAAGCAGGSSGVDGSADGGEDGLVLDDDDGPGDTGADPGTDQGADPGADPGSDQGADPGPPQNQNARIVDHNIPAVLHQGQTYHASITVANTGLWTWTEVEGYKLGAIDETDPFYDNNRVVMPIGTTVVGDPLNPGTVTFEFLLRAYVDQGSYVSDWRMLKEGDKWFGEILRLEVQVVEPYSTCIEPIPPPLDHFVVVVHIDGGNRKVLDSTPKVYGRDYCTEIGFTDARSYCPPRPEGHVQVDVCNEAVVGRASDTGRIGPTWTFNDNPCDVTPGENVCGNHSTNQFLVVIWGTGTARACATNGVCGELVIP
jgi:hypothetical protein